MPVSKEDLSIDSLVGKVVDELTARGATLTAPEPPPAFDGRGILEDIDSAVRAAQTSFEASRDITLERRGAMVDAMKRAALENVERLSRMAVEETGLGRFEDKIRKNTLVATRTPGLEDLAPVAFSGDHGLTIVERAPYGVIGSVTPSTNPS